MGLILAFKAFIKAWKNPAKALEFIADKSVTPQTAETADVSHLRLLGSLQQTGRLIDFLKEDLSTFNDAQIGAVVRKIHHDCGSTLEELVTLRPLKDEAEGTLVQIFKGYNPAEIKLVGKISGEPPFTGVVTHRGWKAQKRSLPKKVADFNADIICPAEIEIQS